MYLVADNDGIEEAGGRPALLSDRWESFPISILSHHGAECCDIAREWVIANDFAQLNGGDRLSGPRWMRRTYDWGPSSWPLHWCEAAGRKTIDCGAHAALAHEAFVARGLIAYRAQFVQRYGADATGQWRRKWDHDGASDHWITDDVIYHEGNALLIGEGEVRLWDGSAGWWIEPRQRGGYGSLVAVRVFAEGVAAPLVWGEHRIRPNIWHQIDEAEPATDVAGQRSAFFMK